ncbi:MAG: VWA domain-containing protein [Pyrinomonadaceae bacterium]
MNFSNKTPFRLFTSLLLFPLLLSSLHLKSSAQTENEDEINVESSLVVLNASITDKIGKTIYGLKKTDFKIFEDGREQTLEFFEAQESPFAAVILIDTSGSMEQRVSLARSAAINFLDGLRVDDKVAIYNFESKVSMVQDFSNTRDITEKVFDLKANGMTVLNDAIYRAALELEKRPEKRRAIIVLSDGADTQSGRSASTALKAALRAHATIYTVDMSEVGGGGNNRLQNRGVLKNFAEKTGGKFVSTPGGIELRNTFINIVEELGNQYTFGYEPQNVKNDGKWHSIEVKVSRPNLNIRTREGYNAQKKSN